MTWLNETNIGRWIREHTRLTDWVVAICTIFIALTGFGQWLAIRGQWDAMTEAERPWVGATAVSAEPIASDKDGVAKLTITNVGRSPAHITRFVVAAQRVFYGEFPYNPPYENNPPYDRDTMGWVPSTGILLPNGMTPTTLEFNFIHTDAKTFQQVLQNQAKFYIYGKVEYEDVRNNSKHFAHICYYWTELKQANPFVHCPQYNDAN